jgi:predicted transport protein
MSDLKLFRLTSGAATEIKGEGSDLEKPLQTLIENNLEQLLGVRLLASEYSTGKAHAGRIDTLGLDENNSPVILEYKRSQSENVINQGLFYLDWLMDHKAELKLLVLDRYGKEAADAVDWSSPRLICIAGDFTKYDEHAVKQMGRNIELIRYRRFGSDLLLLELVNAVVGKPSLSLGKTSSGESLRQGDWKAEWDAWWEKNPKVFELYQAVEAHILALGDDVQVKHAKQYVAFKRLRNFASLSVNQKQIALQLHLDPDKYPVPSQQGRDVRNIGSWGTGSLQLFIRDLQDLERAKPLIQRSYEGG